MTGIGLVDSTGRTRRSDGGGDPPCLDVAFVPKNVDVVSRLDETVPSGHHGWRASRIVGVIQRHGAFYDRTIDNPGCECQPPFAPGTAVLLFTTTSEVPFTFSHAFQSGRLASTSISS